MKPAPLVPPSEVLGAALGERVAGATVQRLMGFWVCWHAVGGRDAMFECGFWSRSGVYAQLAEFKELYGCGPDELLPVIAAAIRADSAEWPNRYPMAAVVMMTLTGPARRGA